MSKPTTFLIEIDYITRISNSSFCKTFEVILDEKFHIKLVDFGTAKFFEIEDALKEKSKYA